MKIYQLKENIRKGMGSVLVILPSDPTELKTRIEREAVEHFHLDWEKIGIDFRHSLKKLHDDQETHFQ